MKLKSLREFIKDGTSFIIVFPDRTTMIGNSRKSLNRILRKRPSCRSVGDMDVVSIGAHINRWEDVDGMEYCDDLLLCASVLIKVE